MNRRSFCGSRHRPAVSYGGGPLSRGVHDDDYIVQPVLPSAHGSIDPLHSSPSISSLGWLALWWCRPCPSSSSRYWQSYCLRPWPSSSSSFRVSSLVSPQQHPTRPRSGGGG